MRTRPASILATLSLALLAPATFGQQPSFPEGDDVPRSLTANELRFLLDNPGYFASGRAVTPPPSGPIACVAEYESMDGIIMSWEGTSGHKAILAAMAAQITTLGNAEVYMSVDNTGEISSATSTLTGAGTNMGRVQFVVNTTDTIWIRDYGPRYVYEGSVRAIVDHTYNRPRPNDNKFSGVFSTFKGHAKYELGLTHGGGNYHLDALGRSFATDLIERENAGMTRTQIVNTWASYQNVNTTVEASLPSFVDSTQHIDMWMQIFGDNDVVISDWPTASGSQQDNVCDNAATTMAAAGYNVVRIPAVKVGSTHYTFTNVVMCNDIVLLPSYTNGTASAYNAQALAVWQAALPTKTIIQINAQSIVTSAGVLHCIVMHVPSHLGGVNPTAYLRTPNGGESLTPGSQVTVDWISDDDVAATSADLLLSTDGGATFPTTVATGLPPSGTYNWTVPANCSSTARLRVVVYDGSGNNGADDSDADFAITGGSCAGCSFVQFGLGLGGTNIGSLDSATSPQIGTEQVMDVSGFNGAGSGFHIISTSQTSTPFKGGTQLVNLPAIVVINFSTSAAGAATVNFNLPNNPGLVGRSFYQQVVVSDASQPQGYALSNGVSAVICP